MSFFANNTVLLIYIIAIIYFVILGCYMLAQRGNPICTHGEQVTKLRMTRSVGIFMFLWAFDYILYLPPMLQTNDMEDRNYGICFLITLMMETPAIFMVMHAIVQKRLNTLRWVCGVGAPFLLLLLWYIVVPQEVCGRLPINIASVLSILFVIFLFVRYAKEYRIYVHRIKSEYSEISEREIVWAWSCFAGFALQVVAFLLYENNWAPMMEYFYGVLSIVNAGYLCYCTCRQKPLDYGVAEDIEDDATDGEGIAQHTKQEEKAFYAIIEQKLEMLCEEKMLFLDPDLTREVLCNHLAINSTYLKLYFRSRGLSFYQYINTLRVEHAYKLMQENPQMPVHEICELSGFRSQTTFRKMFKEVMGCLPSEIRNKQV